jgi:hypothetical protein
MSSSPLSPKLISGGIVVLDAASGAVQRVIALQYNSASVSRSLQSQWYEAAQGAGRSDRLRIKKPKLLDTKAKLNIARTKNVLSNLFFGASRASS